VSSANTSGAAPGTRPEAEGAEAVLLASVVHGSYVKPTGALTVRTYLTERWLPSRQGKLEPSTLVTYQYVLRAHVVPNIASIEQSKLDTAALDPCTLACLRKVAWGRDEPGGHGLVGQVVHNIAGLVHKFLRDAVRWKLLAYNPATEAEPPAKAEPEIATGRQRSYARSLPTSRANGSTPSGCWPRPRGCAEASC
jgi:hypothetical protein